LLTNDKKEKDIISLGRLQIDQQARMIVQNNGESLPLTKTEFDLFCYLARSKGAAISHSTLLCEVMGYRGDVETKALVMHIANIRRKMMNAEIEDVGIETIAGVGYKITEY
jgi:DNA-binding response OmpR family regulator